MKAINKIIFILVCFFAFTAYGESVNRLIAKVNDEVITSKDLQDYCNILRQQSQFNQNAVDIDPAQPGFKEKALGRLIEEKLILDAAKKLQRKREEEIKKDEKKSPYRRSRKPPHRFRPATISKNRWRKTA